MHTATRSDDLVPTPSREWSWWRDVGLRSAGFPAAGVLDLASTDLADAADRVRGAEEPSDEWTAFRGLFERRAVELGRAVQRIARSRRFQLALAWQNGRALATGVEPLLSRRPEEGRPSAHRRREELVAGYWQRYCVKNDTIGFFGPVGWARLEPDEPESLLQPGGDVATGCEIYFESWAVDALADALARDPQVRPWLAPRRVPFVGVADDGVLLPGRRPVAVTPEVMAVLRRCDGRAPARELAAALGGADVPAILEELCRRRWIVWRLEVPVGPRPEVDLRRTLEGIGDAEARQRALAALDRLEAARARLAGAGGRPRRLLAALADLNDTFVALTGERAVRHEGRTYGGRTLVYADCSRDAELRLGADLAEALAPLDLLLRSGRWLTAEVAAGFAGVALDVFRDVSAKRVRPLDLGTFWFECLPAIHGDANGIADRAGAELARRWAAALDGEGERDVRRSAADLRPAIEEAFDTARPSWVGATYSSADVLLAAADLAALRDGAFEVVLGELHLALNTLGYHCFVERHPDRARLSRQVARDVGRPRLLPVLPKEHPPRLTSRTHPALARPDDVHVALAHHTVDPGRRRVVLGADVAVREEDGCVVAVLPTGETFDVLDAFAETVMSLVVDRFTIVAPAPHTPRVTIDRLVAARETWHVDARVLDFATEPDEPRRFVRARGWADALGLPRHVFVKSPLETKPFYVDFASPVYVSILARAARRLHADAASPRGQLKIVEMLPTFDQLWLVDRLGNRYASELRLVAVDLSAR